MSEDPSVIGSAVRAAIARAEPRSEVVSAVLLGCVLLVRPKQAPTRQAARVAGLSGAVVL